MNEEQRKLNELQRIENESFLAGYRAGLRIMLNELRRADPVGYTEELQRKIECELAKTNPRFQNFPVGPFKAEHMGRFRTDEEMRAIVNANPMKNDGPHTIQEGVREAARVLRGEFTTIVRGTAKKAGLTDEED